MRPNWTINKVNDMTIANYYNDTKKLILNKLYDKQYTNLSALLIKSTAPW